MQASEMTFGTEIETSIPRGIEGMYPVGSAHCGRQIPHFPAGWLGESDCSIRAPMGHVPIEIASPILKGEQGLIELVHVIDTLTEHQAGYNESMGVHVHVGVGYHDQDRFQSLKTLFKAYEPAFFGLCGRTARHRLNSGWCKPSSVWDTYTDLTDRYRALNLTNQAGHSYHPRKPTVEFRIWGSKVADPFDIVTAVYMSVSLCTAWLNGYVAPVEHHGKPAEKTARNFMRTFWYGRPDLRIIPDADISDMAKTLIARCKESGL